MRESNLSAPRVVLWLKNVGVLWGLSGARDVVLGVCNECCFEMRTGIGGMVHGKLCSHRSERNAGFNPEPVPRHLAITLHHALGGGDET